MKSIESKVVITIDTEVRTRNRDLPDPYLQDVLGHLSGGDRGTFWITEELEKHGFAGVFFWMSMAASSMGRIAIGRFAIGY